MDYKQDNLFGWQDPIEEAKASLFDKFIVPPFSVLDRRQANWLRDIHKDELKALKVISLSIDKGTLVIGSKVS